MNYKNQNKTKMLILNSVEEGRIRYEDDLIRAITNNLNSIDFDLVQEGKEIEVVEFNIIPDNEPFQGVANNKIYQIYFNIIL